MVAELYSAALPSTVRQAPSHWNRRLGKNIPRILFNIKQNSGNYTQLIKIWQSSTLSTFISISIRYVKLSAILCKIGVESNVN